MIKNTIFYLLTFLSFYTSKSQEKKLLPGYIVTIENDTIHGQFVDYDNLMNISSMATMVTDSGKIRYTPKESLAYSIDGKMYRSLKGSDEPGPKFLRLVREGRANLYSVQPSSIGAGAAFGLIGGAIAAGAADRPEMKEGSTIVDKGLRYYIQSSSGKLYIIRKSKNVFKQDITRYFGSNAEIAEGIRKNKYKFDDLIRIVDIYNSTH